MIATGTNKNNGGAGVGQRFGNTCRECGQKMLAQVGRVKDAIFAEAHDTLKVQDRMLRLALNEAEALALQTLYPHLLFPALAVEKVQAVAAWENRQRQLDGQIWTLPS